MNDDATVEGGLRRQSMSALSNKLSVRRGELNTT